MDHFNDKPTESAENTVDNSVPPNTFLIREGVKAIPLKKAYITIGRNHENMVVVDDPRVSRRHAELRVIRGNFVIFDLNSAGGTYVNGQRTNQGILYSGDLISLAGVNFVISQDTRLMDRLTDSIVVGSGKRDTVTFKKSLSSENKDK